MNISKKDILKYNSPLDETNYYDPLLLVEKARGIYVWMQGDKEPYIDLLMGYSSTNFGHSNADILKIVKESIEKFDNITSFNSSDKIELSKKLIKLLGKSKDRIVYFPVGGTKAVDAALKFALAYTNKKEVITFNGAFHGFSFGGMSVTDDSFVNKNQYGQAPFKVKSFPFPNILHSSKNQASICLREIEEYIISNKSMIAAIIIEPIQGAAGFHIPPPEFLIGLDAIAKKYDIVFICDEIQIGIYRTGTFYYINQLNIDPDIVLLGKSLAGGYYPLSAVIGKRKLFNNIKLDGSGFDSTFANNLLGIRISNKLLDLMENKKINKQVQATGKKFFMKLQELSKYKFIKDINGIGMAFSYRVQDFSSRSNSNLAKKIKMEAFKNHLIIQTAGVNGDYMKISPSFFITDKEIDIVFEKMHRVMKKIYST